MTATMCGHLIVHQYCFQSSNSLWAVLHMPEEREQRIHYVRLSPCSLRISGSRQRDVGWGWVSHAPWSWLLGRRGAGEVPVFVFSVKLFEKQGSCLHVCFLWHTTWCPGLAAYGHICAIVAVRSSPPAPKLRSSCAPADPGPRPAVPPARPPPLRLGAWGWARPRVGLSRRPLRAGLADVAWPHCATACSS